MNVCDEFLSYLLSGEGLPEWHIIEEEKDVFFEGASRIDGNRDFVAFLVQFEL